MGSLALVQRRRIRDSFAVLHPVSESSSLVGFAKVAALSRRFFYLSGAVGIAVTLLQLYNAVFLNAFWPFLTAIEVNNKCSEKG